MAEPRTVTDYKAKYALRHTISHAYLAGCEDIQSVRLAEALYLRQAIVDDRPRGKPVERPAVMSRQDMTAGHLVMHLPSKLEALAA